jgi:hypothetical protein
MSVDLLCELSGPAKVMFVSRGAARLFACVRSNGSEFDVLPSVPVGCVTLSSPRMSCAALILSATVSKSMPVDGIRRCGGVTAKIDL